MSPRSPPAQQAWRWYPSGPAWFRPSGPRGSIPRWRSATNSSPGTRVMLIQDFRFALRSLRRTPGFALASVVTLALGIGATSAVYSVANGILWRPLPVPAADRLAVVYAHRTDGSGYSDLTWPDYRDLRDQSHAVFDDVIAYAARPVSLGL